MDTREAGASEGGRGRDARILRAAASVLLCVGCLVAVIALTQDAPQVLVTRPPVSWSAARRSAEVSIPGEGSRGDGSTDSSLHREIRATSKTIAQARAEEEGETGETGEPGGKAGNMGSLDRKLSKILGAERTAAGAIDMLWKETNTMSSARSERKAVGRRLGSGGKASWSERMGKDLQRLNELELPEAEALLDPVEEALFRRLPPPLPLILAIERRWGHY